MPQRLSKPEALAALRVEEAAMGAGACMGCALVEASRTATGKGKGKGKGTAIAQSEHGLVLLNRFGCRAGHLLVIAREHVERAHALPWAVYGDLQRLAHEAAQVLDAHYRPVRVYSAVLGSPAPLGMTFPHLHVHVVPVMEGDERARPARVFTWSEGVVRYTDGEALELAAALRDVWPARAPGHI